MEGESNTSRRPSSSTRNEHKVFDYLIVIVGFGLCRAWIVFCLTASVVSSAHGPNWIYLLIGAFTAILTSMLTSRALDRFPRVHEQITSAMIFLVSGSVVLILVAAWLDSPVFWYLGLVSGGAGAGFLQVLWGERFAAQNLYFSSVCSPAAGIVTGLFLAITTSESNLLLFIALPIISIALLMLEYLQCNIEWRTGLPKAATENAGVESGDENLSKKPLDAVSHEKPKLDNTSIKLMVTVMVFTLLVRTFDAFPIVGTDPLAMFGGSGSVSLILVGGIFLAISIVLKDRMNVSLVYRLSLPIMIAGFITIALFFEQRTATSVLLIGFGYELFDILSWILFSAIAHRKKTVGYAAYVYGVGVFSMFVGMAAGFLLSIVIKPLVMDGSLAIGVIALIAIFCLAVVAFLVLPESVISSLGSHKKGTRHLAEGSKQDEKAEYGEFPTSSQKHAQHAAIASAPYQEIQTVDILGKKCSEVAAFYGLTPRESEVLEFLARGRTLPIVARDLNIAKNTARSHIEKIYQKTGIHKQQNLIDLIEEWHLERDDITAP